MKQAISAEDRVRFAKLPREERLHSFMGTIVHPHFIAMGHALQEAIRKRGGASHVFLCGPTGVGKTAMKNHVMSYAVAEMLQASRQDSKLSPIRQRS